VLIPSYGIEEPIQHTLNLLADIKLDPKMLSVIIINTPDERNNRLSIDNFPEYKFNLEVIIEEKNGYGVAYKTGIAYIRDKYMNNNDYIVITSDADGTYSLDLTQELTSIFITSRKDFLTVGRLKLYQSDAFSRRNRLGNILLTWGTELLYFRRITDSQSGMWIFNKKFTELIDLEKLGDGMEFSVQIKLFALGKKEIRYGEIEAPYYPRAGNQPQLRWFKDAIRVALKTFTFRFRRLN